MPVEARDDEKPASAAQRIAGGLMIVNAALFFLERTSTPADERVFHATNMGGTGGALVDVALGAMLVSGRTSLLWLAVARMLLSPLLRVAWHGLPDANALAVQLAIAASLMLLLIGKAGRGRTSAGCALFGLYLALGAFAPMR